MSPQDHNRTAQDDERRARLPVTPLSVRHSAGAGDGKARSEKLHRRGLSSLWRRENDDGEVPVAKGKVKWPKRSLTADYRRFDEAFSEFDSPKNPSRTSRASVPIAPPQRENPNKMPAQSSTVRSDAKERPASPVPEGRAPRPRTFPQEDRGIGRMEEVRSPAHRVPEALKPPAAEPVEKEPFRVRVLRAILGLAIVALAAGFYLYWEKQERGSVAPPMVMPQPYFYEEEQPVRALLLWREKIVTSPVSGTVQLTFGTQPAAVAANDVVATVLSRGKTTTVRAPSHGYFLPAVDGAEGRWNYGTLWLGSGLLPQAPQNCWIEDLALLRDDRVIGKLIALPQNPRAVFYLNLTDMLSAGLQRGSILIRRASKGPKWTAHVRVFEKYDESRAKVTVDMPCFPMDMVLSREAKFLVCSDEDSGLIVPGSAVVLRNGSYGVFELVGDRIEFRRVTGKPVSDGRFFVASGLQPGNPVILNAANAEEKRVRLW
ncbi:MAG: hypothetical protein ACOYD9_07895 [Pyramidobacter sp.]|jgi:hypothetical protein